MIRVHYLEESRAHRILWLLEELSVEYDVIVYKRTKDFRAPDSLKSVHPLGKSPVIEDGDRVLAESGAMIEYLVDTYGSDGGSGNTLRPARDTDAYHDYLYWLHYSEGSAMPLVTNKLLFQMLPKKVPVLIRPIASLICKGVTDSLIDPQLVDHVTFWNDTLARDGWFAGGQFSAADIAMGFVVEATMDRFAVDGAPNDRIEAYIDAIQARPAYQRALKRGGNNYSLSQKR
ncbi:glutathione S-transferase [Cohaesibacter sp. ES.047]|uniref:glutathione S-transferase family protein n=1 Tax=Cohaesibacter sp. ES.047 TaxID=1798205 RepID=UPI000BB7C29B|nr:glutathione S-transferase [Cohaesibacter sp. ES.047]SNY93460.1 glutathione S-transferase [Cohaesibacter sp. ES.047]